MAASLGETKMSLKSVQHHRPGWGSVSLLALLATAPAAIAAPAEPTLSFAISGGDLETVLTAYAVQASVQLLYTPEVVRGRRSDGLYGEFTAKAALARLLDGAGIVAQQTRPGVVVLRLDLVASPEQTIQSEVAMATPSTLDEVIVTGTHIRGVSAGPSPVVSFDRDEIDRQGYATVAESLAALPQNHSGMATPDVMTTGADGTSANTARATGVNLRGLGPDATLVLVNGRRMAGTGGKGDFADVSAIPTAAVERIDVLLDGASALYGSDAVGGVVNIILRRNFDGAETRLRYGLADGGAEEVQIAQTFGKTWESGRALISYEYYDRAALPFAARAFTRTADLRPFGGTDRRVNISVPGNIVLVDPTTNAAVPTWGIPRGVANLQPSDFVRGVINQQEPRLDQMLLPHQERHSVYAALAQSLGEGLEASFDLRASRRKFDYASVAAQASVAVSDNNPYFVSPNGSRSHQIYYSFAEDLGPSYAAGTTESLGISGGLTAALWGDWRAEAYGAYAREHLRSGTSHNLNTLFLREAVAGVPDNPATPFRTSIDGFFNPFGDGDDNNAAVLDFIGSGYTAQRYESQVSSANLQADGTLWALPGGDVRMAIGAHVRHESFDQTNETFVATAAPTITTRPRVERTISAAYVELRAPLVGPANARPGLQTLELSLAGRIEHYDDAGTSADPKIGLTWSPTDDLRLRATWGTSFRGPTLTEVYAAETYANVQYLKDGARILSLNMSGGNLDLKPETATSWTVGFDFTPAAASGLRLSGTLFDTKFDNQIDRPVATNAVAALTDPIFSPFVRVIDPANSADVAYVQSLLGSPAYVTPGAYPAIAYGAVVDARYVNTSAVHVRGVDVTGAYGFSLDRDRFDFSLNASYLFDYEKQLTPTSPVREFVATAGQPVDLRARASASWSRTDYGATLALNYVDAYRSETGARIDSWTTADLQVRWTPERFEGLSLAVSVQNLFDRDPPFYDAPTGVAYDATNAEPLGRFGSIQLTKRW